MNENHYQLLKYCINNNCISLWNRVYKSVYPKIKADLRNADLWGADLYEADLNGANLSSADLRLANLRNADLWGADLYEADLRDANLSGANLSRANLKYAVLPNFQICPEEGDFVAYKKFHYSIVGKVLCRGRRVCNLVSRKIRVEQIKPLILYDTNEKSVYNGNYGGSILTKYICNRWTKANDINTDIRINCAAGIHVFITRKEAEEW